MRIGIFTDTYHPEINGVVTSIMTLQQELEAKNHEVFIVTNHKSLLTMERSGNVIKMPGIELKWLYGYVLSTPFHLKAKEEVRNMDLDIIHVHTEFGVGMFGRLVGKSLGIPVVSTYHTMYEDYTHYVNFFGLDSVDTLTKKVAEKFSRYFSDSAQAVICPSEKTKEALLKYGVNKPLYIVPTGLNLNKFKDENIDQEAINKLRLQYNLTKDNFVIGFVGRIAEEKRIDFLIRSFAELVKECPRARLVIVGDGPQINQYRNLVDKLEVSDMVVFTGSVANELIPQYYHLIDVFVSASLSETQGMTYIEALAAGRGVIASNDLVTSELITNGENGYLFDSEAELTQILASYAQNTPEALAQIGENAKASIAHYDALHFGNEVEAIYEEIIEQYIGDYLVEKVAIKDQVVKISVINEKEEVKQTILLSVDDFFEHKIKKGGLINLELLNLLLAEEVVLKAKAQVIKKLRVKDLTRKEVYDELGKVEGLNIEQINNIIEEFTVRRYIDDERYIVDTIERLNNRLYGKDAIVRYLIKHGIAYDDAICALENNCLNDEKAKALKVATATLKRNMGKSVAMAKRAIFHKLLATGFESSLSSEIVNILDYSQIEDGQDEACKALVVKAFKRYSPKYSGNKLKQKVLQFVIAKGYSFEKVSQMINEMGVEEYEG